MASRGLTGPLFVNRARAQLEGLDYRASLPGPLAAAPYRVVSDRATRRTNRRYMTEIRQGDIAYLWPAAPLHVYQKIHDMGLPIIAEGINTRMEHARSILDAVYSAEGLEPAHGITQARIDEENEKLKLTTAIFAPSSGVERSLAGAIDETRILPASYGVALDQLRPPRREVPEEGPTVLFVGSGSVRKGLHQLLRAWAVAGIKGRLLLAGTIDPVIQTLCADQLNRDDVETLGFVTDVETLYEKADVFVLPSYEEGDPLVTYEAAAHGLPIIASAMGAGRIGEESGCNLDVDPDRPESIVEALRTLTSSPDTLRDYGARSATAVEAYGWMDVGARRADQLVRHLADAP